MFAQSIILTPVIIKVSGTETYGIYVLLISYLGIAFGVSSFGVGISAKRWLPSAESMIEKSKLFYPQLWFQFITVSSIALITILLANIYKDKITDSFQDFNFWMIFVYLITYTLYSQMTDYFRYTHRMGIFNIATVAQPYIFIFTAILIYWITSTLNPATLVLSIVASSTVVGVLLSVKAINEMRIIFSLPRAVELKKEIKLGFPLVLSYLVDVILSSGDRYIIAMLLTVRDVGMYSPAYALGSLAMVLPKVFGVVLPPLIAKKVDAGDDDGAKKLLDGAARTFLIVSIPFSIGAFFLGKPILQIYTNKEIADAAWPVISIVAVASIFYGLILIKSNILFVRLNTAYLFKVNLLASVMNIFLNIVLISIFRNVIVSAVATLASYWLSYTVLSRTLVSDPANFKISAAWLVRILASSVCMGMILMIINKFIPSSSLISILGLFFIGFIVYSLLIFSQLTIRTEIIYIIDSIFLGKKNNSSNY